MASCTSGGGGGGNDDEELGPFSLDFTSQSNNVLVAKGSTLAITVQYRNSPSGTSIDVFADLDGTTSTEYDQVQIASEVSIGGAGSSLQTKELSWDTAGVASGTYALMVRDSSAANDAIVAAGLVTVNFKPTLTLLSLALDMPLSRGMSFDIRFKDEDTDDPTTATRFFADVDGDIETQADQFALTEEFAAGDGSERQAAADLSLLAYGSYFVLGIIDDSVHEPVLVQSAGQLVLANSAWARASISTQARSVTTLADGSSVVAGSFTGTAVFGPGEANESSLVSDGALDIFLARYGSDGSLEWARRAGSSGDDEAAMDITSNEDSIIICGQCHPGAIFGQGEAGETIVGGFAGLEPFVARYDFDGSLQWARVDGGPDTDCATGVSVHSDGTIGITGDFSTFAIFGEGEANETMLFSETDERDPFVASYAPNGALLWARSAGSPLKGGGLGADIQSFPDGSVVAVTVDSIIGGPGIIARYDSSGEPEWMRVFEGWPSGCARLDDDSIAVTGRFAGFATFGAGDANETTLINTSGIAMFMARFASDGTLMWAVQTNTTGGWNEGRSVCSLADGSLATTGLMVGATTFGLGEDSETSLPGIQTSGYLARYSGDGQLLWAQTPDASLGSSDHFGLACHVDGSIFATGTLTGSVVFGAGDEQETTLAETGSFLYRINADGDF